MRDESFTTPEPVRFECSTAAGQITIITADVGESTVTLDGPTDLIDAMRVELVGDRLVVSEQRHPLLGALGRSGDGVRMTASLPRGSSVTAKTASSDAELDGSFTDIEIQTASGDLRVSGDVGGNVTVKSASGDVRLPRVRGHLEVRGVSGDVCAEWIGNSVTVATVSGDVRIDALPAGTVSVRSVSGDIVLGIEPGSNVDVDASSASGSLVSEIPLSDSPTPGEHRTVVIRAVTASGDVRVLRSVPAPTA